MSEKELKEYWNKPFNVKPDTGFNAWKAKEVFHLPHETHLEFPELLRQSLVNFFTDSIKMKKFMELIVNEHEKFCSTETKYLSTAKVRFYTNLIKAVGPEMIWMFAPFVQEYHKSDKESHQICAAELVSGIIRGSKFWHYEDVSKVWNELLTPCLKTVLKNINSETFRHWLNSLSYAVRRVDPNRVKWLYDLLLESLTSEFSSESTSKQMHVLQLCTTLFTKSWRTKPLTITLFQLVQKHTGNSLFSIRKSVGNALNSTLAFDVQFHHDSDVQLDNNHNILNDFPLVKEFFGNILEELPKKSKDQKEINEDKEKKEKNALETFSMWMYSYMSTKSIAMKEELYKTIPILCENVEDPKLDDNVNADADELPRCLSALCEMRTSFTPSNLVPIVLKMIWKVTQTSESLRAILAALDFLQVFVFANFMSICFHDDYIEEIESNVLKLISHGKLEVRQRAAKVFCGLIHSSLVSVPRIEVLAKMFTERIPKKIQRTSEFSKDGLIQYHSGVLGLCSIVRAFPYKIPDFVPPILNEIGKHLHGPQIVAATAKRNLKVFKTSHQFSYTEDKMNHSTLFHLPPDYIF